MNDQNPVLLKVLGGLDEHRHEELQTEPAMNSGVL